MPEGASGDNSSVSLADGRQHLCSDWQFPKWTRWRTPVRVSSMRYRAEVRSTAGSHAYYVQRACTAARCQIADSRYESGVRFLRR